MSEVNPSCQSINFSNLILPDCFPPYVILFNPSLEDVLSTANREPDNFIIIFTFGDPMKCVDLSALPTSDYIGKPVWLGHTGGNAVRQADFLIKREFAHLTLEAYSLPGQ